MTAEARLIRVSTRRTGERVTVRVYVYDELAAMRDAAARYSADGELFDNCFGVCQTFCITNDAEEVVYRSPIIVRLWRGSLGTTVVTHELSHAACEVYARSIDLNEPAGAHLHNANEVLDHLHSDLNRSLVARLYALGYYGTDPL